MDSGDKMLDRKSKELGVSYNMFELEPKPKYHLHAYMRVSL